VITTGTTALITGASGGIGEQFARQLSARGVNLVLVARREPQLRALAGELEAASGVSATVVVADLSIGAAPQDIVRRLDGLGIEIDLLINNAGVGSLSRFLDEDLNAVLSEIQLNCVCRICWLAVMAG
jgi:short-subunit dehydrogenase